jgi:hypothetical protein
MRSVLTLFFIVIAQTACAADWWVQPYGALSVLPEQAAESSLTISGQAGGNRRSPMPSIESGTGGGLILAAIPEHGKGTFGLDLEFISGSESMTATLADAELGAPIFDTSTSAFAVSAFMSGRIPMLSSDSFATALGGAIGFFRSSQDLDLTFRQRNIDPETEETTIVDVAEATSTSSSTVFISIFVTEDVRLTDRFGLMATAGYRGVPSKGVSFATESMTGSFKPDFAGPYVRLGLKYDL